MLGSKYDFQWLDFSSEQPTNVNGEMFRRVRKPNPAFNNPDGTNYEYAWRHIRTGNIVFNLKEAAYSTKHMDMPPAYTVSQSVQYTPEGNVIVPKMNGAFRAILFTLIFLCGAAMVVPFVFIVMLLMVR
jgi:hypothetical protein